MCNYTKDNGEQCGRDAEPFCHDHAETIQAVQYELNQLRSQFAETPPVDADEGSVAIEMDASCSTCEASLRRTERLREHERYGGQLVFEAVVECDCGEHVLGAQAVRDGDLPDGWR